MIYFNKNNLSIKTKIIIAHILFLLVVLSIFAVMYIADDVTDVRSVIIYALIFLILEQIFGAFLIYKKLNINDNEFLRYNFCRDCKQKETHIDAMLDNIFKSSPDMITFRDCKFRYAMCSKKFLDFFGYKSDNEVIGKTQFELFQTEQSLELDKYLSEVIKEKSSKTYFQRFNLDNAEYIYESTSSPIINNNEVVGILTLSRDITETIYLRKSLEYSNSKLYALIDTSPLMAYVLDKNGNFILGNARAKELFLSGIDITNTGEKVRFDIEAMKEDLLNENLRIIESGVGIEEERQMVALNGEKYWYKVNKCPMRNSDGEYYAVTTFISSIDAEKKLQEQRETYIATLSHDLKTPAIAQVRALELLLSGQLGDFNEDQKEILKLTLDSCHYMYDMVYTLLSTCKFESGEVVLNYRTLELNALIKECINEVYNFASGNSTEIRFNPGPSLTIYADKIELKRVIINLLSNAVNYAFAGSEIHILVKRIKNNVQVTVKNSSPYIEPEVMDKLFRKYVTHSEKYNKVGVGLGLYLSKIIVEAHQGKIIAKSYKDQTNIFGFLIPVGNSDLLNSEMISKSSTSIS